MEYAALSTEERRICDNNRGINNEIDWSEKNWPLCGERKQLKSEGLDEDGWEVAGAGANIATMGEDEWGEIRSEASSTEEETNMEVDLTQDISISEEVITAFTEKIEEVKCPDTEGEEKKEKQIMKVKKAIGGTIDKLKNNG